MNRVAIIARADEGPSAHFCIDTENESHGRADTDLGIAGQMAASHAVHALVVVADTAREARVFSTGFKIFLTGLSGPRWIRRGFTLPRGRVALTGSTDGAVAVRA